MNKRRRRFAEYAGKFPTDAVFTTEGAIEPSEAAEVLEYLMKPIQCKQMPGKIDMILMGEVRRRELEGTGQNIQRNFNG